MAKVNESYDRYSQMRSLPSTFFRSRQDSKPLLKKTLLRTTSSTIEEWYLNDGAASQLTQQQVQHLEGRDTKFQSIASLPLIQPTMHWRPNRGLTPTDNHDSYSQALAAHIRGIAADEESDGCGGPFAHCLVLQADELNGACTNFEDEAVLLGVITLCVWLFSYTLDKKLQRHSSNGDSNFTSIHVNTLPSPQN